MEECRGHNLIVLLFMVRGLLPTGSQLFCLAGQVDEFPGKTGLMEGREVSRLPGHQAVIRSGDQPEVLGQVEIKRCKALPHTPTGCNQAGLVTGDFFPVPVKPGEDPL